MKIRDRTKRDKIKMAVDRVKLFIGKMIRLIDFKIVGFVVIWGILWFIIGWEIGEIMIG